MRDRMGRSSMPSVTVVCQVQPFSEVQVPVFVHVRVWDELGIWVQPEAGAADAQLHFGWTTLYVATGVSWACPTSRPAAKMQRLWLTANSLFDET